MIDSEKGAVRTGGRLGGEGTLPEIRDATRGRSACGCKFGDTSLRRQTRDQVEV